MSMSIVSIRKGLVSWKSPSRPFKEKETPKMMHSTLMYNYTVVEIKPQRHSAATGGDDSSRVFAGKYVRDELAELREMDERFSLLHAWSTAVGT